MIVALDGTALIVAQPSLQRELGASADQVQWTSTSYLLTVAALLVVAGRLGDRYGHQRLLLVGVLGFGAASGGVALAPGIGWVIGLRALQGVFGALLQPATLALLQLASPPDRLGRAIAIRTSGIGVASGLGPLLGGALVAHLGWQAVFLINVPITLAIAACALAVRIPAPAANRSARLGLTGAALLAAALAVLVHTLAGVPAHGWTGTSTLLGLAATAVAAALFAGHQHRTALPIVPPAVARSRPVTAAMALLLACGSGLFGTLFVTTFFLQDAQRLDPLASSLRGLPLTALMVLGSPVAAALLRRHGPRRVALAGTGLVTLAIAGLSRLGPDSGWPGICALFAVLGAGFAAVMVTATGTVVGDTPPGYAGVVGGLKQTAMNIGPTLGIAIAVGAAPVAAAPAPGTALPALTVVAALGLLPAALLPSRTRPPDHQVTTTDGTSPNGPSDPPHLRDPPAPPHAVL
ncbi:MFS transporter [Kitasatospora sp. NBC_01287]|uniref:MFS transporter n=1 Tax=Kitasatospora sp. NBC_01287 TaxID=2903573 RepID=UPI00224C94A6|nr:MFS transporter [Kitasatospora sp. NBC_01287]MCX4744508.1 MFS transporter [Kitasatospora sp. NBC_01287]